MFHIQQMRHLWQMYCFGFLAFTACSLSFPAIGQDIQEEKGEPYKAAAQSFSGAYLAGRIASSNHDGTVAVEYLKQALTFSPDNIQVKQDLLMLLLSSNQFFQAVPLATQLKDVPEIERYSRLVLAADAFNKKNFSEITSLVALKDPDLMDNLVMNLLEAWALFGQGEPQTAIEHLETLEGPIWYDIFRLHNLALMYGLIGDEIRTQAAFEQLLDDQEGSESSPDSYERIVIAYATYLQAHSERQAALDMLQKAGIALVGRNVFATMRERVDKDEPLPPVITDVREGAAEMLYNIATAINRPGGELYARLYLNIALGMRPDHDATLFQLATIDLTAGQTQSAAELYQRIAPASPYLRDGQWRLGILLAEMGRTEEAITLLKSLLEDDPEDENLRLALSSIYVQNQDFAEVIAVLDKHFQTMDEIPSDTRGQQWRLLFQRGIAHERLQQWERAEADFRASLELWPEQPQVLNYLGYSLIDRDMKLDEALEMVRRAADLRPKDGAIIDSLGWAYYKLGRIGAAIEALEEAVRLSPQDPTINDHLGDVYWQVGRRFEAVFQWNHALAGNPEPQDKAKIEDKLKNGLSVESSPESTQSIATTTDHPAIISDQ